MISRENMIKYGMYGETLTNMEDIELFVRLLCWLDFKFCGTIVAKTRRIDRSAQSRNDKVIKQGFELTERIRMNPSVMERMGIGFKKIQSLEYENLLGALYHAKQYRSFRSAYREGIKTGFTPRTLKFLKRYVLSYVRLPSKDHRPN